MAKAKRTILPRLTRSAEHHVPGLANQFVCPTCLKRIPLSRPSEVSVAHIVPRAASGGQVTLLCRSCNSAFGARQDKWLGEYLRIARMPKPGLLQTRHQKGHFVIGGVRVSGTYRVAPTAQRTSSYGPTALLLEPWSNSLRSCQRVQGTSTFISQCHCSRTNT